MPYLADPQGYGKPLPADEPVIVEQGSSAPAVTDVPAPIPAPTEYNYAAAEPYSQIPPPPASESYGGPISEETVRETDGYDAGYRYHLASNPNLVQTIQPGTDASPTYRYIPPEGSTYPVVERNRDLPPPVDPNDFRPLVQMDAERWFPGEGGRAGPAPAPGYRQVPSDSLDSLRHMYYSGEGAMGRGDPLDPRNNPAIEGARPQVYQAGPGQATGYTRFRPGWGGRSYLDTVAAHGGPPAPPPGYVPELIRHEGRTVSTLDMERSTPRTLSPTSMPPPPNQPPLLPRGGSPYNDQYAPQTLAEALAWMERARQERRHRFPLRGLFGGGG